MKNNKTLAIVIIIVIALGLLAYSLYSANKAEVPANDSDASGKLNIDVICQNALSYMSFPDGASADKFVSECKEGKYPEVIERYKADMNISNEAAI